VILSLHFYPVLEVLQKALQLLQKTLEDFFVVDDVCWYLPWLAQFLFKALEGNLMV
jgi:hypothetical protein